MKKDPESAFPNCYRNKEIFSNQDDTQNFLPIHCRGFEFTHHDMVNRKSDYDSYQRKIQRMIDIKNEDEPIVFFYNHRYKSGSNFDFILSECRDFLTNFRNAYIVLMEQIIVDSYAKRSLFMKRWGGGTFRFVCQGLSAERSQL